MPMKRKRINRLSTFARLLNAEWRKLKLPILTDTIIVAVSGGADSTALLLALEELVRAGKVKITVCVAHFDHGIRNESRKDAKWVAQLAQSLGFASVTGRAKVGQLARQQSENLEQAARHARYEFLERTAKRRGARFVLTAHTMDDQAETVLLRLIRGSAALGLGGMEAIRPISKGTAIKLVRPLLWARRIQTEDYCAQRKIEFLHDEMNEDERFARVKVRKQVLPLMRQVNNRIVEALSRTASLLRDDGEVLLTDAEALLNRAIGDASLTAETKLASLDVHVLSTAPPALRRRALRKWISEGRGDSRRLEMVHILAVEKLLEGNKGGKIVELPNGFEVRRSRGKLELIFKND